MDAKGADALLQKPTEADVNEFELSSAEEDSESPASAPDSERRKLAMLGKSPSTKHSWEVDGLKILEDSQERLLSKRERKILGRLIKQGCPKVLRRKLWLVASGGLCAMNSNPGYYQHLLKDFVEYPNPCFSQIELDLHRTFTGQSNYKIKNRLGELRNVLTAYVKRNPTVGYCQGLNFVAAHLLRYLNEEEAFWVLCMIIETVLPIDYYSIMIGVLIDQKLFCKMIKVIMPHLWAYFKKVNLDPSLVSLQWFICLFSYNFQPELSDEIWDNLLVKGSKVLFKAGLGILSLIEKNIIRCKEFPEAFSVLEREPRSLADIHALVQTMDLDKFKFLTNSFIHDKRQMKRTKTLQSLQKSENRKKRASRRTQAKYKYISRLMLYNSQLKNASTISYDKENGYLENANLLACNESWPLCLYDHTYKNRCISYFAYRVKGGNEFIDDYFEEIKIPGESKLVKEEVKAEVKVYDTLLVERSRHYCTNEEFVGKLSKLLEKQGTLEGAFPSTLVDLTTVDEVSLMFVMENYINHIMNFELEESGHREVVVEGMEEEDEKFPAVRPKRSLSGGSEGEINKVDEGEKRKFIMNRSMCIGGKLGMDLYSRRGIAMSFYLADVASKMPFANSNDIIANSSSGKLLKDIVENQINL